MHGKEEKKKASPGAGWKRVLTGTACAAAAYLALLFLLAVLISSGRVPEEGTGWLAAGCCTAACFFGGRMASRGEGRNERWNGFWSSMLFCAAFWAAGRMLGLPLSTVGESLVNTAAALLGGLLSCLFGGRKKKKRRK